MFIFYLSAFFQYTFIIRICKKSSIHQFSCIENEKLIDFVPQNHVIKVIVSKLEADQVLN